MGQWSEFVKLFLQKMMKRSEFCRIASYKELRMTRRENYRALRLVGNNFVSHADALAEALSPKALVEKLSGYISPLKTIYSFFSKRR